MPLTEQERGALIGLLAASLVNLDHAARRLQTAGNFKHDLKRQLNQLQAQGDKLASVKSLVQMLIGEFLNRQE